MRKALIDKCEEVINSDCWPGEQSIKTARIFSDLKSFYEGAISMSSIQDDKDFMAQNRNASFMPAISQKTIMNKKSRDASN